MVPDDLGVIGIRYLAETPAEATVDSLEFDRIATLRRAIDLITAEAWPTVQEFIAPTLVRRGTTRMR